MPLETTLFVGVVLAAGRSSRMGSPKALLMLEGRTFLSRIVEALSQGGCDRIVVVTGPPNDLDARQIALEARDLGAEIAINPDRSSDQIVSVRAALSLLGPDLDGVLVTPVDAPGTHPDVVRALIAAARGGAPVALPTYGGRRGHPVLFGQAAIPTLASGELPEGARTVVRSFQGKVVEVAAGPEVLLDIDTPADYKALSERTE